MFKKGNNVQLLIKDQIKDVEKCLIQFESFIHAATTPQTVPETLRVLARGVQQAEAEADRSLRAMIDSFNTGAYLPSTRQDTITLATSCDKIANKCETLSKLMVLQKFRFPDNYKEKVLEVVKITLEQFELLEKSILMLFSKLNEFQKDHSILDQIRALESRIDVIEDELNERTFNLDLGLAEKTQISHMTELLCDASDVIEDIADKIQVMLITRKV